MSETNARLSPQDVESPCNDICIMDEYTGHCRGCLRTIDEIAGWASYSPEQKKEVLLKIKERAE